MNWKNVDDTICGALCLVIGWGCGTLLHELCRLMTARSLGLAATPGRCTIATSHIVVHGDMTQIETALVAMAGSAGLILIGLLMIKHRSKYMNMIGLVFLCRAWIGALPLVGFDGAMIAGSVGYVIAWGLLITEMLICGGAIFKVLNADRISRVRLPNSTSGTTRTNIEQTR